MRKTIGICRNKTLAFAELRREHRFNKTIGIYTAGNRYRIGDSDLVSRDWVG